MDEKIAFEALRQTKKILDKHGIEFWLDLGTLLGAVRDGKFIPWDHDIDLGTWRSEVPKISTLFQSFLVNVSKKDREFKGSINIKGCPISFWPYDVYNNTAIFSFSIHNIIGMASDYLHRLISPNLDIEKNSLMPQCITKCMNIIVGLMSFQMKMNLAKIMWIIHEKLGTTAVQIVIPLHYFQNLTTIRFYDMDFKVPSQTEQYLECKYGKDWKIPKQKYVIFSKDSTIVKNS